MKSEVSGRQCVWVYDKLHSFATCSRKALDSSFRYAPFGMTADYVNRGCLISRNSLPQRTQRIFTKNTKCCYTTYYLCALCVNFVLFVVKKTFKTAPSQSEHCHSERSEESHPQSTVIHFVFLPMQFVIHPCVLTRQRFEKKV